MESHVLLVQKNGNLVDRYGFELDEAELECVRVWGRCLECFK
jgi:hypothetical protein